MFYGLSGVRDGGSVLGADLEPRGPIGEVLGWCLAPGLLITAVDVFARLFGACTILVHGTPVRIILSVVSLFGAVAWIFVCGGFLAWDLFHQRPISRRHAIQWWLYLSVVCATSLIGLSSTFAGIGTWCGW